jgi:hypothetical protein
MEQQSIREILFEYFSFRKVTYERPPLEFANGIQSLPIGSLHELRINPCGDSKEHGNLISW